MHLKALACFAALSSLLPVPAFAQSCENGQTIQPGESCEVTIKWGYDHWIKADFPWGGTNAVVFSHLEGECNVALFGPVDLENDVLRPDGKPERIDVPGEYHLFTRAITIAKQTCRYRVSVD